MDSSQYKIPTQIDFGPGSIKNLANHISPDEHRILLVADEPALRQSGARAALIDQLLRKVISIFADVVENPPIESLEEGRQMALARDAQLVIGVGGGSAMDTAKGIATLKTNDRHLSAYLDGRPLDANPLPVICIPTTSGTGSEVTPYAVFTGAKNKQALSAPQLYPRVAIVDPELTYSMPRGLVADTGLDALTHAIEAFLSTEAGPASDRVALEAIQLVVANLKAAMDHDLDAMGRMARASTLAGVAIAHASTILLHVMGYPLTFFHGIPHGRANGILLPAFLDYLRAHSTDQQKVTVLEALFADVGGVSSFIHGLGVSTNLADYNVQSAELDEFVDRTISKDDVKITPTRVTRGDIREIYKRSIVEAPEAESEG